MHNTPHNAHNPGPPNAPIPAQTALTRQQVLSRLLTGLGTGLVATSLVAHFLVGNSIVHPANLFVAYIGGAVFSDGFPIRVWGRAKLVLFLAFSFMFWLPLIVLSAMNHSHPLSWVVAAPVALTGVLIWIDGWFVWHLGSRNQRIN